MIELIAMAVGVVSVLIFLTHVIDAYRAKRESEAPAPGRLSRVDRRRHTALAPVPPFPSAAIFSPLPYSRRLCRYCVEQRDD
jgi:hypothetical protein